MSGPTKQKRSKMPKEQGQHIAQMFFKSGKFTSDWTEHDAKTYFGMKKTAKSVFRTGSADKTPVEWYLDAEGTVQKREIA